MACRNGLGTSTPCSPPSFSPTLHPGQKKLASQHLVHLFFSFSFFTKIISDTFIHIYTYPPCIFIRDDFYSDLASAAIHHAPYHRRRHHRPPQLPAFWPAAKGRIKPVHRLPPRRHLLQPPPACTSLHQSALAGNAQRLHSTPTPTPTPKPTPTSAATHLTHNSTQLPPRKPQTNLDPLLL